MDMKKILKFKIAKEYRKNWIKIKGKSFMFLDNIGKDMSYCCDKVDEDSVEGTENESQKLIMLKFSLTSYQ